MYAGDFTKDLAPGKHHCKKCGLVTNWIELKNKVQACEVCSDRFPCLFECIHLDCKTFVEINGRLR
jgi:hypothetical protein